MAGIAKKTADILNKIIDDIDTVNLKDKKAWKKMLVDLEGLIPKIPTKKTGALSLFSLCREGVELLSKKSVKDIFSLVGGISEALIALEEYLTNKKEDGGLSVIEAAKALESIMERPLTDWEELMRPKKPKTPEKSEADSGKDDSNTLNDIASRLILLDPDDLSELAGLKESLTPISTDSSYPETCRDKIGEAIVKIEAILDASASDPDLNITEIGVLLEDAMNATEEDWKDVPIDPPADPVAEQGDESGMEESPEQVADAIPEDDNESVEETPPERPSDVVSGSDDKAASGIIFPETLPDDADLDLLGEFITESTDLISEAEEALLTLESDPEDTESVGSIFRAFHTVKGVSAFLELAFISEIAHHAESLLSRVRDKEIRYAGGYADLALRSLDMIKQMIDLVQDALGGAPLSKPEGYDDLLDVLADPEGAGISDEIETADTVPRIGDLLVAEGKAEREKVEEVAASPENVPIGVKMVKSKAATVTDVAKAIRTQEQIKGKKTVESSIRVSTSRLDRLIDMVGELVISHSIVAQDKVVTDSNDHELTRKIAQTGKIVREMQDLSMSMRMVPLKATFSKMARLVRDVSRKVGKNVSLVTEGEDTEIDRNMVDVINDPLMHMVRNSVDHGIEMPEVRQKMGKPRTGTVKLSAYHAAGKVIVEIDDDGKGLSRDVILAKAKERGLVTDEASLSDREIFKMIFEAGFSTAKTVTDVSGRGVGMDVVRKNIESLRGQVEIDSEAGKGSVFKMSLPLTLAIIDGMLVRVGSEIYIIPTVSIVTSLKPEPEQISTVLNQGEMLSLHGDLLSLFRLAELFSIAGSNQDSDNRLVVVIEDDNKKRAGLIIDELISRQQIVIKSLGETMKDIPGISGAAIMPSGQVGLILDVGGVVGIANSGNETG